MKRRRRSRGSPSKAEAEKRGKRKFPTTLGTARTRTWQSAQVKPPRSAGRLSLLLTCGRVCLVHILEFGSNDILIFSAGLDFFWGDFALPCVFVFTQHPIETLVSLFDLKKSDVFIVSQIYVHFISTMITVIVYNQINLPHFSPWLQASTITLYKTIIVITLRPPVIRELHTGKHTPNFTCPIIDFNLGGIVAT